MMSKGLFVVLVLALAVFQGQAAISSCVQQVFLGSVASENWWVPPPPPPFVK